MPPKPPQIAVAPMAQGTFKSLHAKAVGALETNLVLDEPVEVVILGPSNQAIIGTDRRAFVFKKGFMTGASFGSEMTSWDYRNLVGVQIHTGMMSGAVVLQGPGQSGTSTSNWKGADDDPYKASNAIPISRPFNDAQSGVAALRQLLARAQHAAAQPPGGVATSVSHSIADELLKLAQLRDSGLLTEEEFTQQKQRLLG